MAAALAIDRCVGETRAALIEDRQVTEVRLWRGAPLAEAVCRAQVTRVAPESEAAFLDLGGGVTGFLTARRVRARGTIAQRVHEGQSLLVQVLSDAPAQAGKAVPVTTALSLIGRYVTAEPFGRGLIVPKTFEPERAAALAKALAPQSERMRLAVRSRAKAAPLGAVAAEADALAQAGAAFDSADGTPRAVLPAPTPVQIALRDAPPGPAAVHLEGADLFAEARALARRWPDLADALARWRGREALLEAIGAQAAIERAIAAEIALPSGGRIRISDAAAGTVIDVDMGASGAGRAAASARRRANHEAAAEIARLIRLAGIGGLILVDFIDPEDKAGRADLDAAFAAALAPDPAPLRRAPVNEHGVASVTRKRSGLSLRQHMLVRPDPHPSAEIRGIALLRQAERLSGRDRRPGTLVLRTGADVATWLEAAGYLRVLERRCQRPVRLDLAAEADHLAFNVVRIEMP